MASSPPEHQLAQVGLSAVAIRALAHAWDGFNVHDIKGTLPNLILRVAALVHRYGPASAVLSNRHYAEVRAAAGITTPFRPLVASSPTVEQIASNVKWATGNLYGTNPDLELSQAKLEGAVGRLVQNVGRTSTINNVESDRTAIAWAREARPDACWFCAMLATRGGVYSSAAAAGRVDAGDSIKVLGMSTAGDAKGFVNRYHDHCHCTVVPVFTHYEQTAHVRAWAQLWNDSTGDVSGMEAKQKAFAAALAKSRADVAAAQ